MRRVDWIARCLVLVSRWLSEVFPNRLHGWFVIEEHLDCKFRMDRLLRAVKESNEPA